jgi:hypothetical protein
VIEIIKILLFYFDAGIHSLKNFMTPAIAQEERELEVEREEM